MEQNFTHESLPRPSVNLRYLTDGDICVRDVAGKIIAIRSAKGTSKTEWLAKQVKPFIEDGRGVLVLTHRIQLARTLADRLGIPHLSEVRDSETGSLLGYALCVDSLHPNSQARFNPMLGMERRSSSTNANK